MNTHDSQLAEAKELLAGMAKEAAELKQAAGGSVTETVADWLGPQYVLAVREQLAGADAERRLAILRSFVQDCALLRRGDQAAARLQLDREKLDWLRANGQAHKEIEFRAWLQRPDIQEELFPKGKGGITPETMEKIIAELNLL